MKNLIETVLLSAHNMIYNLNYFSVKGSSYIILIIYKRLLRRNVHDDQSPFMLSIYDRLLCILKFKSLILYPIN